MNTSIAEDGYTVRLDGDLVPGRTSELTLTVSKAGHPIGDLQPYDDVYQVLQRHLGR